MNPTWQQHLINSGAVIDNHRVMHFGNPEKEIESLQTATVIVDLSDLGLIQFAGEDSQSFLQGQLTNDIRQVAPGKSQYSGYCSPKGRMLANFLLWQGDGGYMMQLPAELRESIQKRLTMYVLRSKVKVSDVSDEFVRLGVGGSKAAEILSKYYGEVPQTNHEIKCLGEDTVIMLPKDRFEIITSPARAPDVWNTLCEDCVPAGSQAWEWMDIHAGIPRITSKTQEQFVPQMVNYEVLGGVNFQKGCYPGQEIVARTQYLGKLKRRMFLAHLASGTPLAGDDLYSRDMEGQATGMIVNAHPSPEGGYDVLAVIQISSAEGEPIHLKAMDGPTLELMPLPYQI